MVGWTGSMATFKKILDKNKSLLNTVLLVSLTSILYIYPFGSHFRFTFSIIVLTTFLLYFEKLSILYSTIITGLVIVVFRVSVDFVMGGQGFDVIVMANVPSVTYYVSFGLLFRFFAIRHHIDNVVALILLLSMTDIISNVIELGFRSELVASHIGVVLPSVVGVAIARSMLAVTGYYALKKHQSFVLANDQAKQYVEQTVMVAKLKSELFYLEKSSQDIENVMEKAYWLYKELHAKVEDSEPNSPLLADQALAVAREIHEIKKYSESFRRRAENEVIRYIVCD